jgi:succinate semialdehyde reductase (NADPH)
MPALLHLTRAGAVAPQRAITRRVPLEEAPAAYAALDRGEIVGRAIVVMA